MYAGDNVINTRPAVRWMADIAAGREEGGYVYYKAPDTTYILTYI